MAKLSLNHIEVYITNVCNYNCDNCNRFNNYYFSGHQYWKDYKDLYAEWATKVNFREIFILGGEPLLNPSLLDWCDGLRELWPESEIRILSNGTRFEFWPDLYENLKQNRIDIAVQLHNRSRHENYSEYIKNNLFKNNKVKEFLIHHDLSFWTESYQKVKDESWPECLSIDDFDNLPSEIKQECKDQHKIDPDNFIKSTMPTIYIDDHGVKVFVEYSENFFTSPLKYVGDNQFEVYNSNPTQAHNVCPSKHCHHLIRGKLYKCHNVALLPEFMQQFDVRISDEDTELLNSYQPMTVDRPLEEIKAFLDNLPYEIPQCKLCPANLEYQQIQSSTKKIKLVKKPKKPKELVG
jgi:organic radical activating enzyme